MDVRLVSLPEDFREFGDVALEYELSLPHDLRHRDFEHQRRDLESHYGPPNAAFLAKVDGTNAGCVAVTQLNATTGVIKKLYVKPEFRGHGVARALMKGAIDAANARGFHRLVLDTDRERLNDAYRLYRALGFEDCEPYGDVDYPNPAYMELKLQ